MERTSEESGQPSGDPLGILHPCLRGFDPIQGEGEYISDSLYQNKATHNIFIVLYLNTRRTMDKGHRTFTKDKNKIGRRRKQNENKMLKLVFASP